MANLTQHIQLHETLLINVLFLSLFITFEDCERPPKMPPISARHCKAGEQPLLLASCLPLIIVVTAPGNHTP